MSLSPLRSEPATPWRGPGAPPAEAAEVDLNEASLRIDDGLLMVFGPEADPLTPDIFLAAAATQPDATVKLPDGSGVAASRVATVLEAQTRGRLVDAAVGAEGWLLAMLGQSPAPQPTDDATLAAEIGHDLTIFGDELLIGTPGGRCFILRAAAGRTGEPASARILGPDGQALGHAAFLSRLRLGAVDPAIGRHHQPGAEVVLAGCLLGPARGALELTTPAGERFRLAAPGGSADAGVADGDGQTMLLTLQGEVAGLADLAAALGLDPAILEAPAPTPLEGVEPVGVPGLPRRLHLDSEGVLDLSFLGAVVANLAAPPTAARIFGLPGSVRLSLGEQDDAGNWHLPPESLGTLTLFATPEGLSSFTLSLTLETGGHVLEDSVRIEVADDLAARLSLIEPLEVALVFPPPLSPRNDLSHLAIVMVTGLPSGTTLSAGVPDGDGRWSLTPADLADLHARVPAGATLPCRASATGISIQDREGLMSTATAVVTLDSEVLAAPGSEQPAREAPLDLTPLLALSTQSQRIDAIAVTGLPPAVALTAGAFDRVSACWVLRPDELADARVSVRDPHLERLTLKATAVITDATAGRTAATTRRIEISIPRHQPPGEVVTRAVGFFRRRAARPAEGAPALAGVVT